MWWYWYEGMFGGTSTGMRVCLVVLVREYILVVYTSTRVQTVVLG